MLPFAACRKDPCSCRISIILGLVLTYLAVFSVFNNAVMLFAVMVLISGHIVWEFVFIVRLVKKGKIGRC